ncbi:beta-glucosidase BglX [Lederbergia citri]|uniref:beta-glucosidase n=1 Tax=Lederbergia citri TaxID=2833580 RepID=A0A942TI47_9BACI|nr:beta-glucosidase BglX [Lederbergia citri]MBS4196764.1 beta-glucosidase BglX [Lederbergia citri]
MNQSALDELLSKMTLEEKIDQLLQLTGDYYKGSDISTGPSSYMKFEEDTINNTGSILNVLGAKKLKQVQTEYLEKNRHKIPLLFLADIINGYKTIFPIPLGLGSTFNPDLVQESAEVAAKESAASGLHITFSPMVDLVRDPRWGRVMESTGEDAYLNGLFGAAMVKGYQGKSLTEEGTLAACVKHFAAYGAPEGGRDYNTVDMSERTLREQYLPAYKAALDAGCAMVMTAFNTVDGIPATGNKWLMKDLLRDEWGFEGVLISDYAAIAELMAHGVAEDGEEAARLAIEAGVDIDMVTPVYVQHLKKLVDEGKISEQLIDESVMRVLQLKNQLGLFENPYRFANEEKEKELILCEEHRSLARKIVSESLVLLKNEGALPLCKNNQNIAFIGPYADNKGLSGLWSIHGDTDQVVTLKEAVMKKVEGSQVHFAKGSEILDPDTKISGFAHEVEEKEFNPEAAKDDLQEAIELAKKSDVVVLALGEHSIQSGEGGSRAAITLPEIQLDLFRKIHEVNQNIVVVLFNGRPLDLKEINEKANAIVEAWFPGTEGGNGIADVLFNDVNPSGKLSMSFPYSVGQIPVYYNSYNTGRPLKKGEAGHRFQSRYTDIPNEPLYPFGFGLSYTEFEYSGLTLDKKLLTQASKLTASITVKNTGDYAGKETVQLYIQDLAGSVIRPVKELKGIKKIELQPGESKTVEFNITEEMLRFYTASMKFESENGKFKIFIGSNSETEIFEVFELKREE